MTLRSAQWITLEANRNARAAQEGHHVMPREQFYAPKKSSVPKQKNDFVKQTKSNLNHLEESSLDDGKRNLSKSQITSTIFHILTKRPHQGDSWVVGTLTNTQVAADRKKSCFVVAKLTNSEASTIVKVPSLECLYSHRQMQLFLSAHVGDIKMAT